MGLTGRFFRGSTSLGSARRSDFAREGPVLDLLVPALHLGETRRGRGSASVLTLGLARPAPCPLTQLMGHSEWYTRK